MLIRDDARGTRRHIGAAPDCFVADAHRGVFLVDCSQVPFVITRNATRLRSVPGEHDSDAEGFGQVGTRWLVGTSRDHGKRFYLNWHTGERRAFGETASDAVPRDLDSRDLRPLPAPDVLFRSRRLTVRWRQGELVLKRRAHRRVVLDRCNFGCRSVSVGAGLLTWAHGRVARGLDFKTLRRFRWKFKRTIADFGTLFHGVQHTASYVYFNVPRSARTADAFDVRRVRRRR